VDAVAARELGLRVHDFRHAQGYSHTSQGAMQVLKGVSEPVARLGGGTGKGLLVVDDLVDTGATARVTRELMPESLYAAVYAKPLGRPQVDLYVTEVSQDTWIQFPWDTEIQYAKPLVER